MRKILFLSFLLMFLPILTPNIIRAEGTYNCAWTGATCYTDIAGSFGGPYTCTANFGHCQQGDSGCTPCEAYTDYDSCVGSNPRSCIEQNEDIVTGYYCAGTSQCQPCFDYNTNQGCNPPQYSSSASCEAVCTGQEPIRYNCNNDQCVEAENGTYGSSTECNADCGRNTNGDDEVFLPLCDDEVSIDTAIGCIPIKNSNAFIAFFLRWAIGIGGGISFLLIVYAGFQIATSSGNPDRIKAGQELLTSAIAGLIMLVFSVFILKIIGIDILGLAEFGFGN